MTNLEKAKVIKRDYNRNNETICELELENLWLIDEIKALGFDPDEITVTTEEMMQTGE